MQMVRMKCMIRSVRTTVVLDTNVIYPVISRDILFWFAHYDLYIPKWSEQIFDEWKRAMIKRGVSLNEADKRMTKASAAFPDALVQNYKSVLSRLDLPDKNDCHVLAAAIKTNAHLIVTNNLKHFPDSYLLSFRLKAKSADEFLTEIIDLHPERGIAAFREMVLNKKNPSFNLFEVLNQLKRANLSDTADSLLALL